MLGIGIIGIGMIGGKHAAAIAESRRLRLVACYHRDARKAGEFAATHGCRAYADLDAFLSDQELDLVDVCTPSGLHLEPALAAAKAGKHLVIEKPLEITVERCTAIMDACEEAGVVCSGVFQSRFSRGAETLKTLVQAGAFGRLVLGTATTRYYRSTDYYEGSGWHGRWDIDGGGAVMNQSIHAIDILSWLFGPVESVTAFTGTVAHPGIEVEDVASAALRFKNGALGTIVGSTAVHPGYDKTIEVAGYDGSATMTQNSISEWHFRHDRHDAVAREGAEEVGVSSGAADPSALAPLLHRRQLEDVADAIETGREPAVGGRSATEAVAIVRAIYESARLKEPVSVRYR